ncbi:unnamed protein product [Pieris macdunnoughi]|uniref:Uncharacterized protein n=1 Tax=Pieris macdunnoughi TaxID=345717 RepID=A0A821XL72_9NEOP|nr:unnamed protein product [Pieris macdunnoughi]
MQMIHKSYFKAEYFRVLRVLQRNLIGSTEDWCARPWRWYIINLEVSWSRNNYGIKVYASFLMIDEILKSTSKLSRALGRLGLY